MVCISSMAIRIWAGTPNLKNGEEIKQSKNINKGKIEIEYHLQNNDQDGVTIDLARCYLIHCFFFKKFATVIK